MCVRVCMCVRARACACVRVRARARACVCDCVSACFCLALLSFPYLYICMFSVVSASSIFPPGALNFRMMSLSLEPCTILSALLGSAANAVSVQAQITIVFHFVVIQKGKSIIIETDTRSPGFPPSIPFVEFVSKWPCGW